MPSNKKLCISSEYCNLLYLISYCKFVNINNKNVNGSIGL